MLKFYRNGFLLLLFNLAFSFDAARGDTKLALNLALFLMQHEASRVRCLRAVLSSTVRRLAAR